MRARSGRGEMTGWAPIWRLVEVVGGVSLVGDKGGGPQSIMQSRGLNDGAPVAWGRTKLTGRLRASTQAWILVPRPPRERPSP